MPQKIKGIFKKLLEGAMTLMVYDEDERRFPIYGGGFKQDRANMRGDFRNVAGDMRRAVRRLRKRQRILAL